jgi:cytochrome oxidase Cu insertion factor (SCO1/SenC/PrrC family)
VVKDPEEYDRLMNKFREIENFDASDVYLIDPYGFIMMRYDRSMNPKGIIKDVERLIKNSS